MNSIDQKLILEELAQANQARQGGNEGRARVCARRAAGWAVVYYRRRAGELVENENALDNLNWLADEVGDPQIQAASRRLLTRVQPDYTLPHEEDPLQDAQAIVEALLESPKTGS